MKFWDSSREVPGHCWSKRYLRWDALKTIRGPGSLYLLHPSPKAAGLRAQRTFSAHAVSPKGKWSVRVSHQLPQPWGMLPKRPPSFWPSQNTEGSCATWEGVGAGRTEPGLSEGIRGTPSGGLPTSLCRCLACRPRTWPRAPLAPHTLPRGTREYFSVGKLYLPKKWIIKFSPCRR